MDSPASGFKAMTPKGCASVAVEGTAAFVTHVHTFLDLGRRSVTLLLWQKNFFRHQWSFGIWQWYISWNCYGLKGPYAS